MKMFSNRNLLFILILSGIIFTGCRTGLLSQDEPPTVDQTPAPSTPVVVEGVRTSYADVVEKTSPAVVRILVEGKASRPQTEQSPFDDFFRQLPVPRGNQRPQIQRGLGSGVIASADGTILTNAHVIDGATKITAVLQDNKTYEAKLVGTDKPSDLAVLKIEAQNMPYLTLGNSDTVRVGDIVLAIGNPLGIGQTVTSGIISAKGRRTGISDGSFEDFLQTDAPINRGNSGGALVNLNGELIGINSQILSSGQQGGNIGIAFSIPSNMAKSVMEQLLKDGKVRRGRLGVMIQNITDETAQALDLKDVTGVIVSDVQSGSSAEKAGIKRGDIITAINGEKIEDGNVLRNKIAGTMPGSEIKLSVVRDGNPQEFTATLDEFDADGSNKGGEQPKEQSETEPGENGKLGLSLQPISPALARQFNIPDGTEGLIVTSVDPDGPAASSGLERGDAILEINRTAVKSIDDVQAAIERSGSRPVLLLVSRGGQASFITIRPR